MSERDFDTKVCSIADCKTSKGPFVRGMCRKHYVRGWRSGLPDRPITDVMVRVKFGIPREVEKAMRRMSRVTGQSLSALYRRAVSEFIGRAPSSPPPG